VQASLCMYEREQISDLVMAGRQMFTLPAAA
jgi:hypothetical protein